MNIRFLFSCSFCGLAKLQMLDLTNNDIYFLPENIFRSLNGLSTLHLSKNKITHLGFHNVRSSITLMYISADKESTCCIARSIKKCEVKIYDIFTTCDQLLGSLILRYSVWFILTIR